MEGRHGARGIRIAIGSFSRLVLTLQRSSNCTLQTLSSMPHALHVASWGLSGHQVVKTVLAAVLPALFFPAHHDDDPINVNL